MVIIRNIFHLIGRFLLSSGPNGLKLTALLLLALLHGILPESIRAATDSTETAILNRNFRTLKTSLEDLFMSPPVMRLGTDDHIIVSFDEISEQPSDLKYRLIHCNANWEESRLLESEYVDGFNFADVEDIGYSSNTFVHYINYRICIPDDNMRILASGNYLLQVFERDDPDNVILQTRFMVSENRASIGGTSSSRTDRGHYSEWQQLDFSVNTEGIGVANPYLDIETRIYRNDDPATVRILQAPSRTEGPRLFYSHSPELIFPASNEFRRFESVSNSFAGMNVDSLRFGGSNYHVWLRPDEPRADRPYQYDRTQHGRFIVREYNASDSDLGADYITVHFSLDYPDPEARIFLDGEFTRSSDRENFRMKYNPESGYFETQIPLKQGAYNYQYLLEDKNSRLLSPAPIEGNKYETDNEYSVAVYYHPPGARADRLIGFGILNNL